MDLNIAGKRALVLGASKGLGAASARALQAEGVEVWSASRSGAAAEGMHAVTLDLSDAASVAALIAKLGEIGGVDILVNNSGGPKPGPAQGAARPDWAGAFDSMALALFAITDAVLPGMIERQWGRIVTIGSSGVVQPIHGLALSNGVRGAVAGWSKTLAGEVARHGITVNMVLPGRIDTDRVRQLDEGKAQKTGLDVGAVKKQSEGEIPTGRYGRPEEFGATVAFLCGQPASYITGSMLRVDGGMIKGF